MVFIYDNMIATMVAITVTMMLLTIQYRATQISIAQTSRNMVKQQAQSFATWLEKDLETMGQNIDRGDSSPYKVAFENPQNEALTDSTDLTTQFTFYRDSVDSDQDTIRIATRYEVEKEGTRMVEGESKDLYELTRQTKVGSGSWSQTQGASAAALGYFDLDMLNKNAVPIQTPRDEARADPDTVRSTRVRFSVVAPFQNERTSLRVVHFGSVLLVRKQGHTTAASRQVNVPDSWWDCVGGGWKALTREDGSSFHDADACMDYARANQDSDWGDWWD